VSTEYAIRLRLANPSSRQGLSFYDDPDFRLGPTTPAAFYPGSGRQYTLRLTGSIEGTRVDELFLVTFPAYPRVATRSPAAIGAPPSAQTGSSGGSTLVIMAAAAVVLAVIGVIATGTIRRRRPAAGPDRSDPEGAPAEP